MKLVTFNRAMFVINAVLAVAAVIAYRGVVWGSNVPNLLLYANIITVLAVLVAVIWVTGCGVENGRAAIKFAAFFLLFWAVTAVSLHYLAVDGGGWQSWDLREAFNREWFTRFALLALSPALTLVVIARFHGRL